MKRRDLSAREYVAIANEYFGGDLFAPLKAAAHEIRAKELRRQMREANKKRKRRETRRTR